MLVGWADSTIRTFVATQGLLHFRIKLSLFDYSIGLTLILWVSSRQTRTGLTTPYSTGPDASTLPCLLIWRWIFSKSLPHQCSMAVLERRVYWIKHHIINQIKIFIDNFVNFNCLCDVLSSSRIVEWKVSALVHPHFIKYVESDLKLSWWEAKEVTGGKPN